MSWELFRGHLLDANRTRDQRTFAVWHLYFDDPNAPTPGPDSDAPVVSIRWDAPGGRLFVTRNLLSRGWEAYEARAGVIESRPVLRWLPELVATLDVAPAALRLRQPDDLARELRVCLGQAWQGVSRLPITSVESPLPVYSLGRMAYLPDIELRGSSMPARELARLAWLQPTHLDAVRRLETGLRAAVPEEVGGWLTGLPSDGPLRAARTQLIRALFHHVSLSPYTGFTESLLRMLEASAGREQLGADAVVDLLGYMIRHLVRHLTAYDLVTFHSFGANYPDALWLDRLLHELLRYADGRPDLFLEQPHDDPHAARRRRVRRRALRHAWLVRRAYEGHRVPDLPTSRGEHLRVLPGNWPTAPEEQILHPEMRRKRLFEDAPTDRLFSENALRVLDASVADLAIPEELCELGTATFLDRPFGIFKLTGEVDRTPLLAYEAVSRSLIARRLAEVRRSGIGREHAAADVWDAVVEGLPLEGIPAANLPGSARPGVIMLEDARQAGPDFVIRSIVSGSLNRLAEAPGMWNGDQRRVIAAWSREKGPKLLIRSETADMARRGAPWLTFFDAIGQPRARLALAMTGNPHYAESHGMEYLKCGLRIE